MGWFLEYQQRLVASQLDMPFLITCHDLDISDFYCRIFASEKAEKLLKEILEHHPELEIKEAFVVWKEGLWPDGELEFPDESIQIES